MSRTKAGAVPLEVSSAQVDTRGRAFGAGFAVALVLGELLWLGVIAYLIWLVAS
jgi:hypothetical protein